MSGLGTICVQLLAGVGNTLALFALTLVLSLPLGLLLALMRTGTSSIWRRVVGAY
ncbi:MAG: amino acid ABC transporter permease, partial [Clostridia bacterium]|nr:amino acid ABC transporter permease [Clostridia bacterium]